MAMQDRKEQAKAEIARLVERYQGFTATQRRAYNEEETKKDFILPLFKALGWDVDQKEEVAAEVSASNGRVDYAFKLHGVPRLYVEAKALGNDLTDSKWARQAVTYAYHKGVTWAVLCSFSHLKVFNANMGATDAAAGQLRNLSAGDFLAHFDWLWHLSKEATTEGTLEAEAEKEGRLPTRIPVEKRLYGQLRDWRETLFNSIARYERHLTRQQIDEIIQRLFNRLIFIRTCEDRGLGEEKELLAALHRYRDRQLPGSPPLLQELRRLFGHYRRYYDSDLFDLHPVDTIHLDDPLLEEMLSGLHGVPGGLADYDFSLIDADVLGAVYEQYLGHVAQEAVQREKRAQQQLRLGLPGETTYEIASKRERRKEQGIYYTPLWVTDYIVRQTVGAFIAEHKDRPDAIYDLKILDMSCGSGSFLIRAYDRLLRWQADTTGIALEQLTQEFRMPLLRQNIFGVDLDPQAIEIARLNLLLRALAQRALLPSLADNVIRGNSLISGTPADLKAFFGDGWEEKHPLDWAQAFPKVMQAGGFDIIVGNPPYVEIRGIPEEERTFYRKYYKEVAQRNFDLYVLFVERALQMLKPGGRLGFITSGKFLRTQYGKPLCKRIAKVGTVERIVDLSHLTVFADATTYPLIMVIRKGHGATPFRYMTVSGEAEDISSNPLLESEAEATSVGQEALLEGRWPPVSQPKRTGKAFETQALSEIVRVFHGIQTNADPVFILQIAAEARDGLSRVKSKATQKEYLLEEGLLHPFLMGRHVRQWHYETPQQVVLFPYRTGTTELLPWKEVSLSYPNISQYLEVNRIALEGREKGKLKGPEWYGYSRLINHNMFGTGMPRLIVAALASKASFAPDFEGKAFFTGGGAGVYGLALLDNANARQRLLYLLGLLNSSYLDRYVKSISSPFRGGFYIWRRQYLEPLPIRRIDFANTTDKAMHDGLVALVERMLALQERVRPVRGTGLSEEQDVQREIERVDGEIDGVVYELYGLTEGERRLVEGER